MHKSPDIDEDEEIVKKHIRLTKSVFEMLENEAWEKTGGNFSWLLRIILRKHYKLPHKGKARV